MAKNYFLYIFICCCTSPLWAGELKGLWVENRGTWKMVRDTPSSKGIVCDAMRPGERLPLVGASENFYKVRLKRGDCSNNIGYLSRKSGDIVLLRQRVKAKQKRTKINPANTIDKTAVGDAESNGGSMWQDRWGVERGFYLAGRAGAALGLKQLEDVTFVGGLELGIVPLRRHAFTLALPISYASPGLIDIGDGLELDVHMVMVSISPQYRLAFGDSAIFTLLRADVGVAFAFGSFSQSIDDVFDYSLLLRPGVGLGYQTDDANIVYLLESGANLMPVGYGVFAASAEVVFAVQYWF